MSNYSIEEFKIWKGVDPDKPTWNGVNMHPGTREGAEELVKYLKGNCPEREYRIVAFVTQQRLDRMRHDMKGARRRVKDAQGYVDHLTADIAEMKREAYRQGIELK